MSNNKELPLVGPPIRTFFYYAIPSLIGLLAISTTSVIDGLFIGHILGANALAAVNFLIPYLTLMFALALMIAIGGSVIAGKCLGEKDSAGASAIFTQSMLAIIVIAILMASLSYFFESQLFRLLGAPEVLHTTMSRYYQVISFCLIIQLPNLVLYYFIRLDGNPVLGTQGLIIGAMTNISLDGLFIGYLGWGIESAAWATTIAQAIQCLYLSRFFKQPNRRLRITLYGLSLQALARSLYNGCSEFINELSVGIVIFTIHWLIVRQSGEQGIAGFAIANYLLFVGMMIYYGFIDSLHILISQNVGAGKIHRVHSFMAVATITIGLVCIGLASIALYASNIITGIFLDNPSSQAGMQAKQYLNYLWPCFLFSGFNVLLSAYFTAMQQPIPSACISLLRGLILPITLLLLLSALNNDLHFLYALPLAEAMTLFVAVALYIKHRKQLRSKPIDAPCLY
ncbi:MATE family efflux transporter [Photobacterium minamisatsumaniensis]|uniref:MATE family efflux transporter n=1 Tax=Photobacterium minamisatsumaniensis TaxID=2910233 RepID=UPI003D0FCA10